jgi:hypothetical protein
VHAARTPSEVLDSVERFFEYRAAAADHPMTGSLADLARVPGLQSCSEAAGNEDPGHGPSADTAAHFAREAEVGT